MSRVLAAIAILMAAAVVTLGTTPVFTPHFMTADSTYYPRILEAVRSASPEAKKEMLQFWSRQTSDGFVSPVGLDRFLNRFGYCSNLGGLMSATGCSELPSGIEAQSDDSLKASSHSPFTTIPPIAKRHRRGR